MPNDHYRAEVLGARRHTLEEALDDVEEIERVLGEHAPHLLPLSLRPITESAWAESIRRKSIG